MPEKNETYAVEGYDSATLQILVYGAFQRLNWDTKYAGPINLIAYTPGKWKNKGEEINVQTQDNRLVIISKLIHGESFDITGKNKKHIKEFIAAFEEIKRDIKEEQKGELHLQLNAIKESTIKAAEEEIRQKAEIDKVMKLSTGNRYITYGIIAINAIVFIAMAVSGVSLFEPSGIDIIKWGANYAPLTLSGDWWRLITCVFVHIGIIHIVFNMYALLSIGVYLEPMLGKARYITAYLCTGIFASMASLWWHTEPVPSAGASGAIFGMYGVFLALLTTNIIPKQTRKALLQSIAIFVGYNLLYGLKSGVDNAAHIGGLLSGLLMGYIYYFTLKEETTKKIKPVIVSGIAVLTVFAAFFYLQTKKASAAERESISKVIEGAKFKEGEKFDEKYNDIINLQETAMAPLKDTMLSDEQRAKQLMETSLPQWEKAHNLAIELKSLIDISPVQRKKAEAMPEYIVGRENEIKIINRIVTENNAQNNIDLAAQREKLDSLVTILNSQ